MDLIFVGLLQGAAPVWCSGSRKCREYFGKATKPWLYRYMIPTVSVFCRGPVTVPSLPSPFSESDDSLLAGLDDAGARCLNGIRVSRALLQLVPNSEVFRTTLRAIKAWAVARGVYSSVLGFLGGVSCAILVASVCQKNPEATPAECVRKFFVTWSQWDFAEQVSLLSGPPPRPACAEELTEWHPGHARDRAHVMKVITPCYPMMNSTYNIGVPQLRIIRRELQ